MSKSAADLGFEHVRGETKEKIASLSSLLVVILNIYDDLFHPCFSICVPFFFCVICLYFVCVYYIMFFMLFCFGKHVKIILPFSSL